VDEDATPVDAAPVDDTAVAETSADTAVDSTTDTGVDAVADTRTDTGTPVDTGVGESGGTLFPCGGSTCSSSFQYCHRATSPGICPSIDAGICPAGCPGCPPLSTACDTMPSKCWAKPSCACLLVEVCGSASAGDCVEKDGGFTVGCRGV
jgi:hypothetical protein